MKIRSKIKAFCTRCQEYVVNTSYKVMLARKLPVSTSSLTTNRESDGLPQHKTTKMRPEKRDKVCLPSSTPWIEELNLTKRLTTSDSTDLTEFFLKKET